MKELLIGIIVFMFSITFTLVALPFLILYSIIKNIINLFKNKDWKLIFKLIWKMIDGYCASIGHILFSIGYSLDMLWNVNGELIEDVVTKEDDTTFGEKNTPVSASIGKLELDEKLTPNGENVSKFLNLIFWEKNHATDSWNFLVAKKELRKKFFKKKGKFRIVIVR